MLTVSTNITQLCSSYFLGAEHLILKYTIKKFKAILLTPEVVNLLFVRKNVLSRLKNPKTKIYEY